MKIKVYTPDNITFKRLRPGTNWFGELVFIPFNGFTTEETQKLLNILHSNRIILDIEAEEKENDN